MSRQMQCRRAYGVLAAGIVGVLAWTLLSGRANAAAALTTTDLVRFLKAGISEETILVELQSRRFAEPLDATREAALRAAGASETLVVAVRRAAPEATPTAGSGTAPETADLPASASTRGITFSADTRTVRVPVAVLDKQGQPVLGLKSEDFKVSEDGKPQQVTLFSGERRPLRIALALDVSRSMSNKMRQVEEALRHFIDVLEPADQILVMTFSDDVRVVQDFTSDREVLGHAFDRLQADGRTALYDAAYEAIDRVAAAPAESKAVVLVTDGVDTTSTNTLEDLRDLARHAEVPVFSIGLESPGPHNDRISAPPVMGGWPGGRGRGGFGGGGRGGWGGGGDRGGWGGPGGPNVGRGIQSFDAGPLNDLADDTGGRLEIVKDLGRYSAGDESSAKLKAAVETIAMILRHRYLIGYEPPTNKHDWRKIKVEVDRAGATARARKGYYAGA
jgi:VWFA-related protein